MFDPNILKKILQKIFEDSNFLITSIQILAIQQLILTCTHVHAHQDTHLTLYNSYRLFNFSCI